MFFYFPGTFQNLNAKVTLILGTICGTRIKCGSEYHSTDAEEPGTACLGILASLRCLWIDLKAPASPCFPADTRAYLMYPHPQRLIHSAQPLDYYFHVGSGTKNPNRHPGAPWSQNIEFAALAMIL